MPHFSYPLFLFNSAFAFSQVISLSPASFLFDFAIFLLARVGDWGQSLLKSGGDDEPSSSLALYFRICAYFESHVTLQVTVLRSRLRYCSAEVILWLSACSFFHFTCYFAFSLISLFVMHFFVSHEASHTERCVSLILAYSRLVSADFGYRLATYIHFLTFLHFIAFHVGLL